MVLLIFRGVLGILRAVQCVLDIPWLIFYDMLTIFYVVLIMFDLMLVIFDVISVIFDVLW